MKLQTFHAPPPVSLGIALEEFEAQFRYPLGPDTTFSISHGRDYITFFTAMGDATLIVAEHHGRVLGTLSAAIRSLQFPDGSTQRVAYLGDLKIAPSARGSTVLGRILQAMHAHLAEASGGRAYGVVMDGTGRTPPSYTGRLAVPPFAPIAKLNILRIPTPLAPPLSEFPREESSQRFSINGISSAGGNSSLRSEMQPQHLAVRSAYGRLEDTRLAKRLLISPTEELRAAHLSRFTFSDVNDGANLLRQAAHRCAELGIPTLFTAVPPSVTASLLSALGEPEIRVASATIFGCGFGNLAVDWWLDTAEI